MIEKVINRRNMHRAYRQVLLNKGSAGVDGMTVKELSVHWKKNRDKIATALCNGKYLAQPILRVEYPRVTERHACWVFPPLPTVCYNKR